MVIKYKTTAMMIWTFLKYESSLSWIVSYITGQLHQYNLVSCKLQSLWNAVKNHQPHMFMYMPTVTLLSQVLCWIHLTTILVMLFKATVSDTLLQVVSWSHHYWEFSYADRLTHSNLIYFEKQKDTWRYDRGIQNLARYVWQQCCIRITSLMYRSLEATNINY